MTIIPESELSLAEIIFAGDSEMAALMRSHDWSTTPLGPVENWSQSLRTTVSTVLASRFAQSIFWGEDYIQLYNDAVIPIYGANHPKALGQPARETWVEIWHDQVKPVFESVRTTGEAFFAADQLFHPARFGYLEETYFTLCYSPVRDETGKVSGMLCTSTETTQEVIGQRRLTMLRELATAGNGAKTCTSACVAAAAALNPYDIPFALFYQVNEQGNWAGRVALSGLNADSAAAPGEIALTAHADANDLTRPDGWSLADVLQSREPLLITDVVDRFGALPGGPWPESPHSAFILPILSGNKEAVECLLVAGISPRLQFNAEYRSFLELVAQQVESSIATARSYEQERQRAEALAELNRAKTLFFNNVSHEFRTPLTLMLGPAEDALSDRDDPLSPNQQQQLKVIQRNGLRLLKLVNTLLDFSRIESDRISAVYEPTDLAAFTAELASVFRSMIERAGLRFVVDCPPLPEAIYVDREMWEKIVLNLISNAFKFTFAGTITVQLHLVGNSLRDGKAEQVELAVQDTGIGIPAAEIEHLFERFYRVKGAQGRTFEGSGIGLSLVQELVKLHGGTIQVSSVEGAGSCFKVLIPTGLTHLPSPQSGSSQTGSSQTGSSQSGSSQSGSSQIDSPQLATATGATAYVQEALGWLPESSSEGQTLNSELQALGCKVQPPTAEIQPQDANIQPQSSKIQPQDSNIQPQDANIQAQDANTQAQSAKVQAQSAKVQALGGKAARILLVDDNTDMRAYLKRQLSQRWQVDTAANGAIALTQIQQHPPDLVLTDVMMPEMDGLQLLRVLRANPQTSSIPVILLSALAGEEATIEGLETGADDYLIKPFSVRELIARIETHLQLALLRQEQSTNRFKTEFLLTITHELQSPLALILGWARLLQTKSFDAGTMAQALAAIERSATIEANLIKDLLDVAGLLSGQVQLKSQFVELVPLLQSVTAQFRAAAEAKQIQLIKTVLNVPQRDVIADGDRLKQIIANLLDNAIKFTPEGGRVDVRLECVDAEVQITVTDTGIGISPDFLPYVFDRFTQAEVPSRHSPGGVGIGLAIARLLVELHHGSIEVASEGEGRGGTFTVRLPLINAELNPNSLTPGR